jgi:hypothetical protein
MVTSRAGISQNASTRLMKSAPPLKTPSPGTWPGGRRPRPPHGATVKYGAGPSDETPIDRLGLELLKAALREIEQERQVAVIRF